MELEIIKKDAQFQGRVARFFVSTDSTKSSYVATRSKMAMFRPTRLNVKRVRLCSTQISSVSTDSTEGKMSSNQNAMFRLKLAMLKLACYVSTDSIQTNCFDRID